jgi:nitroreductase
LLHKKVYVLLGKNETSQLTSIIDWFDDTWISSFHVTIKILFLQKKITMQVLFNHKSIRKYRKDPVDKGLLTKILEAGTRASTTGNMQVYSIVVTQDEAIKNQLWEAHFKQNMITQAPIIMTFCADFNRFNKWCLQRNAVPGYDNFLSFTTATIDALLAAQNVCIAAESNNLGICYLGTTTYMAQKIIDILQLPKGVIPITTIVMGYPDESPGLTDRLPLEAVVHYETYKDYSPTDIDHLYFEKEHLQETLELLKVNNKQTLAQIFTDKRYTKKDNIAFSNGLLDVLQRQGFMNNME